MHPPRNVWLVRLLTSFSGRRQLRQRPGLWLSRRLGPAVTGLRGLFEAPLKIEGWYRKVATPPFAFTLNRSIALLVQGFRHVEMML
jgi:hypothetical protein